MNYRDTSSKRMKVVVATAFACATLMVTGNVGSVNAEPINGNTISKITKPQQVPDGYELTPAGWLHSSCVHSVAENEAVIEDDGNYLIVRLNAEQIRRAREVQRAGNSNSEASKEGAFSDITVSQRANARVISPCVKPKFDSRGNVLIENVLTKNMTSTGSAWKTNANAKVGNMSYLHAQWNVPPAPTSAAGQTIFFFPGFEDNPGSVILQPVLTWTPSSNWTLTNWNCGSPCFHGPSIPVTGGTVSGDVSGTGCNTSTGVCSSWTITALDWRTQRSTSLNTNVGNKPLNWTFGGVLEAYSVSNCSHLPGGSVTFSNLYFEDVRDVRKYPNWHFVVNSNYPNCGFGASGNSTAVTLSY